MNDFLSHINNARLKDNPMQVAMAVDAVLKLFDRLEITVKQSAASDKGTVTLIGNLQAK